MWCHTDRYFPVSESLGWYWQYLSARSKVKCPIYQFTNIINILPLVEVVTVDYHKKKKIFFLSVVIFRNTLNQRQYVLYYTECPSEGGIAEGGIVEGGIAEGGIAGCGISLQYHPLPWWVGLRKVREKYHIYIYQWNCRIIKEICIKYSI